MKVPLLLNEFKSRRLYSDKDGLVPAIIQTLIDYETKKKSFLKDRVSQTSNYMT